MMPCPPPSATWRRSRAARPAPEGARAWILRGCDAGGRAVRGRADAPPLATPAAAEVTALATRLAGLGVRRVLCSPLERCMTWGSALSNALEVPLETAPALRAQHRGDWQGVEVEEYEARWSAQGERYWNDPLAWAPPAGETEGALEERACAALSSACARAAGGVVVLVTHACVQRALVGAALGLAPGLAHRIECGHARGILVASGPSGWALAAADVEPRAVRLADGR